MDDLAVMETSNPGNRGVLMTCNPGAGGPLTRGTGGSSKLRSRGTLKGLEELLFWACMRFETTPGPWFSLEGRHSDMFHYSPGIHPLR